MNDEITEQDIDNMVEADIQYKEERERMTPYDRMLEALRIQQQALKSMVGAIDRFMAEEKRLNQKHFK